MFPFSAVISPTTTSTRSCSNQIPQSRITSDLLIIIKPPGAALVGGARPRARPAAGGALLAVVDLPVVAVYVDVCPGGSQSLSDSTSFKLVSQPVHPTYLQKTILTLACG